MSNFLQGYGIATQARDQLEAGDSRRAKEAAESDLYQDAARREMLWKSVMAETVRAFMTKKQRAAAASNLGEEAMGSTGSWGSGAVGRAMADGGQVMGTAPATTKFTGLYDDTKVRNGNFPSAFDDVRMSWANPGQYAQQSQRQRSPGPMAAFNDLYAFANGGAIDTRKGKKYKDGGEVKVETIVDKLMKRAKYFGSAFSKPKEKEEAKEPKPKEENAATRMLRRRVDQAEEDAGVGKKNGGLLRGPGTGTSDSIPAVIDGHTPARLSDGEYVIPADVVQKFGKNYFDQMVSKHHRRV